MDITIVDAKSEWGGFTVTIAGETDEGDVTSRLGLGNINGEFPSEESAKQALVQFLELCANTYETHKLEFERDENNDLIMT